MNRALRAATMGVLLLSPVVLTACSAGQVTQTATQNRDKAGPQVEVGDIALREVMIEAPSSGRYDEGDDAELRAAIVNTGDEPDTLLTIESDAFAGVRVLGDTDAVSDSSGLATELNIEIPRVSTVFLGGDGPTILLEDLSQSLTSGQGVELTMTFETAGSVTVLAVVDSAEEEVDRGEAFDYHQEEGEEAVAEGE